MMWGPEAPLRRGPANHGRSCGGEHHASVDFWSLDTGVRGQPLPPLRAPRAGCPRDGRSGWTWLRRSSECFSRWLCRLRLSLCRRFDLRGRIGVLWQQLLDLGQLWPRLHGYRW